MEEKEKKLINIDEADTADNRNKAKMERIII